MKSKISFQTSPQPSEQLIELHRNFAKTKFILKNILEDDSMKNLVLNFNQMDVKYFYN